MLVEPAGTDRAAGRAMHERAGSVPRRGDVAANLVLLGITAVWGTGFTLQKIATREMGSAIFNVFRFGVAVLVLLPLFWPQVRRTPRRELLIAGGVGLVLGGAMMTQSAGLVLTTASVGGFLSGLPIVMTPLLAIPLLGERPGPWTVASVLIASLGVALISLADTLAVGPGDLLVLISSVGFALQIVLTGRLANRIDPRALGTMQVVGALLACLAGAALFDRIPRTLTPDVIAITVQQGAINLGLVWVLQSWAQRRASATRTALVYTMQPAFALLFAWLWLGETLSPRAALGAAAIFISMLVASLGPVVHTRWTGHRTNPA